MSGSPKRKAVLWLREPGDHFAHAYDPPRREGQEPGPFAACGLSRRAGAAPDDGLRCRNCKFALSRNRR